MVQSQRSEDAFVALSLAAWLRHGRRGIVLARTFQIRTALLRAAVIESQVDPVRVIVPTRLLVEAWEAEVPPRARVFTYAEAMRWSTRADQGLIVFDQLQAVGAALVECVCTARDGARVLGLAAGDLGNRFVWDVAPFTGPVLARQDPDPRLGSTRVVLELELSVEERFAYESARDRFVAVYDLWRGNVGMSDWGSFVIWARESASGRSALRAWHESRRILAWTEAKDVMLGEILARHRGQRILILTADKASSYAISRAHLVMPLTGDLSMTERRAAKAAFVKGGIKVLVAPRLLDDLELADVDVVVEVARRRASRYQVPRAPLLYDLCTRQTAEVARQR